MHLNSQCLRTLSILSGLALSSVCAAQTDENAEFEAFLKQRQSEFSQYEQQQKQEFESFVSAWREAESAFLEEVTKKWHDPTLPSSKVWVQYADDLNSRTTVDFESGEVIVELLNNNNNDKQAIEFANAQVEALSDETIDKTLSKDPIYIAVNHTLKTQNTSSNRMPSKGGVKHVESFLQKPSSAVAQQTLLSKKAVKEALVNKRPKLVRQKDRVKLSYKLSSTTLSEQAKRFLPEVQYQAARYNLEPALLLAIIHTESSFNPLARSSIPAFGLMQIVPVSAGKDVSKFLQGQSRLLSPNYLYQADNNVEAGSTYIHILSNRYFKDVHNKESRRFMTIAAYNTGPGNVAKTLSGSKLLSKATAAANAMSSNDIYTFMITNLPAQETRNYLQKVVQRTAYYEEQLKGM
jgi:membrane-bound lytic murein transglycosylase C